MIITLDWLKQVKVCRDALLRFHRVFGQEATIEEVRAKVAELGRYNWEYILELKLRQNPLEP
jgi:hypothetical protein